MRYRLLFLVFLCMMFNACKEKTYHTQLKLLYKNSVPILQPDSLAGLLATNEKLLLLDTRSRNEWEVSHIAGTSFADYDSFSPATFAEIERSRPVVVYCAVGYRSEKVGSQLKEAGFEQVYNLFGGIIEWKNKGFAVVDSTGAPTEKVHTYDRYWGIYLTNGRGVHEK